MRLSKLLQGVDGQLEGNDPEIGEVRTAPEAVHPGALCVARRGPMSDGHAFVKRAPERRARAVVIEWPMQFPGARVLVPSAEQALEQITANWRPPENRGT